jgi:hypothetical protein
MKSYSFLLIALTISVQSFSQTTDLTEIFKKLKISIKEVSTIPIQYSQSFEQDEKKNTKVNFTIVETDKKGKSTESSYLVELSDINKSAVSYKILKDIIQVHVETKLRQKYITVSKNKGFSGYDDSFDLYAGTIDDARAIVDFLKKASEIAEKSQNQTPFGTTYESIATWLENNVKRTQVGTMQYEQTFKSQTDTPLCIYKIVQTDAKGKTEEVIAKFNWSDFNSVAVAMEIKSDRIQITIPTKNKFKFVSWQKNGKTESNTDDIVLLGNDIDQMKVVLEASKKLIGLTEKLMETQKPVFVTLDDAFGLIQKGVQNFTQNSVEVEQVMNKSCNVSLNQKSSAKSILDESFEFNLIDINEKTLNLEVKESLYIFSLSVLNKQKYIKYSKNGVFQGYENEVEIKGENIETMRYLKSGFEKAIFECKALTKTSKVDSTIDAKMAWITSHISNIKQEREELKQTFEKSANMCSIKFTAALVGEKKTTENTYEFSLKDINANATMFEIMGKSVLVKIYTNNKEKIIKATENGKPVGFANEVMFRVDDLEKSRKLTEILKQAIKQCERL